MTCEAWRASCIPSNNTPWGLNIHRFLCVRLASFIKRGVFFQNNPPYRVLSIFLIALISWLRAAFAAPRNPATKYLAAVLCVPMVRVGCLLMLALYSSIVLIVIVLLPATVVVYKELMVQFRSEIVFSFNPDKAIAPGNHCDIDWTAYRFTAERNLLPE